MPETPREHIEAVADEISGIVVGTGYYSTQIGIHAAREAAEALLTSTDAAVLDALTDALVRAGRLRKEVSPRCVCGHTDPHVTGPCDAKRSAWISGLQFTIPACSCGALRPAAARLVTGWRDGT